MVDFLRGGVGRSPVVDDEEEEEEEEEEETTTVPALVSSSERSPRESMVGFLRGRRRSQTEEKRKT